MSRIFWRLALFVSRMLEPDERDAVLGDFVEHEEMGGRAAVETMGLIVRREAALWRAGRPWLVLLALVLPVGLVLSVSSIGLNGDLDLYLWIIQNRHDIDRSLLESTGLAIDHGVLQFGAWSLLLAIKSWCCGFVIGALSQSTIRVSGSLFCLTLLLVELLSGHSGGPYQYDMNAWVLPLEFYTVVVPLILLVLVVLLPSIWGIHQGLQSKTSLLVKAALWSAAILTALTFRWSLPLRGPLQVLFLAVYWPLAYVMASTIRQHWRAKRGFPQS